MTEWWMERGIGETRFARIVDCEIVEARILLDGIVPAGTELAGKLQRSGFQLFARSNGEDYLLPEGAHGVTDGASFKFEVTRERVPGAEPWKRPLGRLLHAAAALPGKPAYREQAFPGPANALDAAGWNDLLDEVRSGIVRFEGGELRIWPTPAMTLIDVDGTLPPDRLARHAAIAAGKAIRRLNIAGSIGIDFPTIEGKTARADVGRELDHALRRPFERTGLNGFGFMQIVRPKRHASLLDLVQDRPAFEARALLRRAALDHRGAQRLVAHPAVVAVLEQRPQWVEALARQVGGAVTLRADPTLAISAGYAQRP